MQAQVARHREKANVRIQMERRLLEYPLKESPRLIAKNESQFPYYLF
jgi:hypothetical protein